MSFCSWIPLKNEPILCCYKVSWDYRNLWAPVLSTPPLSSSANLSAFGIFIKHPCKHQPHLSQPRPLNSAVCFCLRWNIPLITSEFLIVRSNGQFSFLTHLVFSQHLTWRTILSWNFLFPWLLCNHFFLIMFPPLQPLCFRNASSVVRRQSHKPFALCKLLLDDQFTAHEFIYHLFSLKFVFNPVALLDFRLETYKSAPWDILQTH